MRTVQRTFWHGFIAFFLICGTCAFFAHAAVAADEAAPKAKSPWSDNVADAMKQAAAEKKDLLLDFTGSDWCHWCIKLHDEVFDLEPFKTEAPKKFVLVSLDFPQNKAKLSPATIKQNQEWQEKLSPPGFPTIFLTDEKGVPYAKTGYQPGGPEKYLSHLKELAEVHTKRDKALELAAKSQGAAKAKALDEAVTAVGEELALAHYTEQVKEIVALDADNKAGLKGKYEQLLNNEETRKLVAKIQEEYHGEKPDEFVKKLDEAQAKFKPTGDARMELFSAKLGILGSAGKHEAALKVAQELLADKSLAADDRLQVSLQVAGILTTLDRIPEAVKVFDDMIAADGGKGERRFLLHFYKAQTLASGGKMAEAEKAIDDAIAAAPEERIKKQLQQAKEAFKPAPPPGKETPPEAPTKDAEKEKPAAPEAPKK